MLEIIERFIHVIGSIFVLGIFYIEADDVYGWTNLRKQSKRRYRKFLRQFFKTSTKYVRSKK